MLLATFLSCKCFSYELLDFLGMATRESRHAYFCFLQTPQFSKDLRVYLESPQKIIVPFSRLDLLPKQIIFNFLFKIFGYIKNSLYLCSLQ